MFNHGKLFPTGILIALVPVVFTPAPWAQTRPIAIVGATLIDGTGRGALPDSVIIVRDGRFQDVGQRGEVSIPPDAEVIEAKGKSILPGLIDGHCHYRDWMGEIYLAYGVVTCPNISNNPVEWIIAQREGVKNGSIRGPRIWASANIIDGPPPEGTGTLRRQRTSIIVDTEEEARKAVRGLVEKGVDGIKLFERLKPKVAKAAVDEAHKLGRPVFGHSLDIFTAAENGYQSVEHSWAVVYTSIQDPKKKHELDIGRMRRKIDTDEVHAFMEPAMFDKIIQAMIEKNVHWSPTWATWFRPLSIHAEEMKRRELALLKNPQLKYLPAYILKDTESFFAKYEKMAPEKRNSILSGYRMLQDFVRRFAGAGGKIHAGSDPNHVVPGYAVHAELQMLVEAGLRPVQAIQTATLNVAQAWGKEKDHGSIEKGKVADFFLASGDPTKNISDTQNVEAVFIGGKKVDISYHADYHNPLPRPIEDRPEGG
ncbi:MAG TPA: amidohydrolase family protein [Methylomirabilota bacterium]|nr:amidohydrolase family protein [Methylomirabilota bacterium]